MVRPYRRRGVGVKDTDVAPTNGRVAVDVACDTIQVHGEFGFVSAVDHDGKTNHLASIWRGNTAGEIYFGANEVQLSKFSVTPKLDATFNQQGLSYVVVALRCWHGARPRRPAGTTDPVRDASVKMAPHQCLKWYRPP
jgi:hypothetical protein